MSTITEGFGTSASKTPEPTISDQLVRVLLNEVPIIREALCALAKDQFEFQHELRFQEEFMGHGFSGPWNVTIGKLDLIQSLLESTEFERIAEEADKKLTRLLSRGEEQMTCDCCGVRRRSYIDLRHMRICNDCRAARLNPYSVEGPASRF